MIALVDYGAGNLTSVRKALSALGAEFMKPATPDELKGTRAVIVPGVGHFAATSALDGSWREAIGGAAAAGTPLFGICVGMQWLFEGSDEAPGVAGLGVMKGQIARLDGNAEQRLKVPHVGWNALDFTRQPEGWQPARGERVRVKSGIWRGYIGRVLNLSKAKARLDMDRGGTMEVRREELEAAA